MLGADVIKIESASKPDALRFNTIKPLTEDGYWEWSPLQHGPNSSKRSLTLDMSSERGRDLALDVLRHSDVAIENFSPRVVESWGLTWERVSAVNDRLIYLRAPAYGLAGPWRDRVGYAQTIEMTSGLAWVTGFPEGSPDVPNGVCDPNAGLHALVGLLVALEHRRQTGEGMLLEAPMIGGALNVAGEQVVTASEHGVGLGRVGNRSPVAAPQGIYRTATDDLPFGQGRWVAISIVDDDQWFALASVVGISDPQRHRCLSDRMANADTIDEQLAAWCATREADAIVEELWDVGVPVAKVVLPHEQLDNEQLRARGWFTTLTHPVTGANEHAGFPARFGAGPDPSDLHRSPPPTLGQHNREILGDLLGLSDAEIATLESDGVIGTRVPMAQAW
jgi:crotonobetainyl-CoA:carnitine CoA-transferase CaiB-like acyl-CoA transferase